MYLLYIKKKENKIKVSKAHKAMQNIAYTDEVIQYNDCYFICNKREPLVEKAKVIKAQWIFEKEEELKLLRNIKI
ncbi:hypothetical protein [Lysinibacillus odysseyi]|uniref:Uncharacterized protein n=1 Tax=Lysinibacillus odysseyi 34hs-1 = NBRC 100172 TaxID=1220589 RepID=A0A0A3IVG6_9BACI|nr:hypothetical protein [Lysinibacillus odysseyi]KGR88711.1 hypothetical protein CD32_01205 [Lysinibacillus odysseyi 34hs-1 = NBRC 100172]